MYSGDLKLLTEPPTFVLSFILFFLSLALQRLVFCAFNLCVEIAEQKR